MIQSRLLSQVPGILHGFGDRATPVPPLEVTGGVDEWRRIWEDVRPRVKQVHSAICVEVTKPAQECGDCDARYSKLPGVPIHALSADCVPILLAHREGLAVAAVHAGWRGTKARILEETWSMIARDGHKPEDWVAAIGPAIGPCCYEVSEELVSEFLTEFHSYPSGEVVPTHRHLDLPRINELQLRSIGLGQVDLIRACTRCAVSRDGQPLYHSFRREGGSPREWSVVLKVCEALRSGPF